MDVIVTTNESHDVRIVRNSGGFKVGVSEVTTAIITQDDETLSLGWTPAHLKAEITTGTDGLLYKRKIAPTGLETWELA